MISATELQQDNMEKRAAINQHIDLMHRSARAFIEETSFLVIQCRKPPHFNAEI